MQSYVTRIHVKLEHGYGKANLNKEIKWNIIHMGLLNVLYSLWTLKWIQNEECHCNVAV